MTKTRKHTVRFDGMTRHISKFKKLLETTYKLKPSEITKFEQYGLKCGKFDVEISDNKLNKINNIEWRKNQWNQALSFEIV